jgi:hypothetical protein
MPSERFPWAGNWRFEGSVIAAVRVSGKAWYPATVRTVLLRTA